MSTAEYPFARQNAAIAVGMETNHGEPVAPTRTLGKIVEAGDMPDPTVEWQEERTINAGGRELSGKEAGQNTYDGGSLTVLPVDEFPFEFLLGNDADGDGIIEVNNDPLPRTMTVEAAYFASGTQDDFVRTFAGNAPDTGTIGVDNESQLTIDLDFIAQGVTTGTTATDVGEATGSPWLFHDASSNLNLAGTEYARVTDFEWELSNNLSADYYIHADGAEDPFEISYGNAAHSITATIIPTDDSLYQELIGRDDAGSASIAFTKPDGAKLEFEYDNIGVSEAPHSFPEEGSPEVGVSLTPNAGRVIHTPA